MEATVGIIECGAVTEIPPSNGCCFTIVPAKFWTEKWFLKKGFPTGTEIALFATENIFTSWGRCTKYTSCCTGQEVREKWSLPYLSWLRNFYLINKLFLKKKVGKGSNMSDETRRKRYVDNQPIRCFNRTRQIFSFFFFFFSVQKLKAKCSCHTVNYTSFQWWMTRFKSRVKEIEFFWNEIYAKIKYNDFFFV